jgi:hypothetical protein
MRECQCRLCRRTGAPPDGDRLADEVARRGWATVSLPVDARRPAYAFTVGLWHSFGHAEVAVFGRPEPEMLGWLDTVGGAVQAGRVVRPDGSSDDVVGGVSVFPRPVLAGWHRHLFAAALGFYRGQPVPMLQLVWSDEDDVRLWDRAAAAPVPAGWPFPISPDALVLTTKAVAFDGVPVAGVVHDEDGEWQFLHDPTVEAGDLTIVHLAHVFTGRPELAAVGDLRAGYEAWRDRAGHWHRQPLEDVPD